MYMYKFRNALKKTLFFLTWILTSYFVVLFSYYLVGAIPETIYGMGYFQRLSLVIHSPFGEFFNDYSPIVMVFAFILTEVFFGILLIYKFTYIDPELEEEEQNAVWEDEVFEDDESEEDSDEYEEDFCSVEETNEVEETNNIVEKIDFENVETDSLVEKNFESSDTNKNIKKNSSEKTIKRKNEPVKEAAMDGEVYLKMVNAGYDINQIKAMMELTIYIPNIDDLQLKKMFDTSMSADDIREYIEVFYG